MAPECPADDREGRGARRDRARARGGRCRDVQGAAVLLFAGRPRDRRCTHCSRARRRGDPSDDRGPPRAALRAHLGPREAEPCVRADDAPLTLRQRDHRSQADRTPLRPALPDGDLRAEASAGSGFWAMPILHGERLIGTVDPKVDRERGRLEVITFRLEHDAPRDRSTRRAIESAVEDLAAFAGPTDVTWPKGIASSYSRR